MGSDTEVTVDWTPNGLGDAVVEVVRETGSGGHGNGDLVPLGTTSSSHSNGGGDAASCQDRKVRGYYDVII